MTVLMIFNVLTVRIYSSFEKAIEERSGMNTGMNTAFIQDYADAEVIARQRTAGRTGACRVTIALKEIF